MSIPGDFSYKIGSFSQLVPQFLPDTVVIRPYGEYGMALGGYWTKLGGVYGVNTQSYQSDPSSQPMTDLVYLVKNDLKLLPTVKRVLIAIYWYTSNDIAGWQNAVGPAIGPEVQSWNWSNAPPLWKVGPWTRSNAYWLTNNHQVWPTPEDSTLVQGIQYLQSQGYQVGLLPINALLSRSYYFAGGGDWEIDRYNKVWRDPNALTTFLNSYQSFIQHYADLCVANNIHPWLFSIGSGMRDLMTVPDRTQFPKVISMFQALAQYAKRKLPNSLITYFADIDEYFYPYLRASYPCFLDPLWTTLELDCIGVNWFAPLVLDDSEDTTKLTAGVTRGEGYSYYLPNFSWRQGPWGDRFISLTTNNFKTGLTPATLNPRINGVKDIEDWLVFNHYYPAISGRLAGCTPPNGIVPGDPRVASHIIGNGVMISEQTPVAPASGGIAPAPPLHSCYVEIDPDDYCHLSFSTSIPDNSQLAFQIDFALNALTSTTSTNYRVFATSFGLMIDVIAGTVTLQLPQSDGTFQSVPLFTLWNGSIQLHYKADEVRISVGGTPDRAVLPITGGTTFVMPSPNATAWFGNPPAPYQEPAGYSAWSGRIYYLQLLSGQRDNISGGSYYFEDIYNGIRTAWEPAAGKPWVAITGYGSIIGSGEDPLIRPETVQWTGAGSIPPSYPDAVNANAAVFWNNHHLWNIQGPYGCTFVPDDVYQAVVLYCATLGLEPASPQHIASWFFDTRSPTGRLAKMPSTQWQIFNDAYDAEIDCSLNGKAAVRSGGTNLQYSPDETVDERLGLSIVPGPLPPVRAILVEPGVPQQ